ncbi:MAG: hypothetical protein WKI04_04415 [Ferruginibacter sp.]
MIESNNNTAQAISSRDMLFGDLPLDYWGAVNCNDTPWNLFKDARKSVAKGNTLDAVEILKNITRIPGLESRQYLQAYHFINELQGFTEDEIKLLGVVVEVSMPEGHDTLAIYADHSARYYNYSGNTITWEHGDNSLDQLIDTILVQGMCIVAKIGPWKDVRPGPPGTKMARINFLTSHGLHFGEANQQALFNDAVAGKTMYAMLDVMQALINKSQLRNTEIGTL